MERRYRVPLLLVLSLFLTAGSFLAASLETQRFELRPWKDEDFSAAQQLHQDENIVKTFLAPLGDEQVKAFMAAENDSITTNRYGRFACVLKDTGTVVGLAGLHHTRWMPGLPWIAVSIRIMPQYQGNGYAKELIAEVIRHGFEQCNLQEIGVFIAIDNVPSRRLFENWGPSVGIKKDESVCGSRAIARYLVWKNGHVLYAVSRADWQKAKILKALY